MLRKTVAAAGGSDRRGTVVAEAKELPPTLPGETCMGPPLDFSFKEIKAIEDLVHESPRAGKRKPMPREADDEEAKKAAGDAIPGLAGATTVTEGTSGDAGAGAVKEQAAKPPREPGVYNVLAVANVPLAQAKGAGRKFEEQKQAGGAEKKKVIALECRSLLLNNNEVRSLAGFDSILEKVMIDWHKLAWLDLSHNFLTKVDFQFAEHCPSLSTLYLHANYFNSFKGLGCLANIFSLKTLTLHGNPIEQISGYRLFTIGLVPHLKRLDSVLITKKERDGVLVWNQGMGLQKVLFKKRPEHPRHPPALHDDNADKDLKPKDK